MSKTAEKAKDKEIDGLWKKMSDFETLVMELKEGISELKDKNLGLEGVMFALTPYKTYIYTEKEGERERERGRERTKV